MRMAATILLLLGFSARPCLANPEESDRIDSILGTLASFLTPCKYELTEQRLILSSEHREFGFFRSLAEKYAKDCAITPLSRIVPRIEALCAEGAKVDLRERQLRVVSSSEIIIQEDTDLVRQTIPRILKTSQFTLIYEPGGQLSLRAPLRSLRTLEMADLLRPLMIDERSLSWFATYSWTRLPSEEGLNYRIVGPKGKIEHFISTISTPPFLPVAASVFSESLKNRKLAFFGFAPAGPSTATIWLKRAVWLEYFPDQIEIRFHNLSNVDFQLSTADHVIHIPPKARLFDFRTPDTKFCGQDPSAWPTEILPFISITEPKKSKEPADPTVVSAAVITSDPEPAPHDSNSGSWVGDNKTAVMLGAGLAVVALLLLFGRSREWTKRV